MDSSVETNIVNSATSAKQKQAKRKTTKTSTKNLHDRDSGKNSASKKLKTLQKVITKIKKTVEELTIPETDQGQLESIADTNYDSHTNIAESLDNQKQGKRKRTITERKPNGSTECEQQNDAEPSENIKTSKRKGVMKQSSSDLNENGDKSNNLRSSAKIVRNSKKKLSKASQNNEISITNSMNLKEGNGNFQRNQSPNYVTSDGEDKDVNRRKVSKKSPKRSAGTNRRENANLLQNPNITDVTTATQITEDNTSKRRSANKAMGTILEDRVDKTKRNRSRSPMVQQPSRNSDEQNELNLNQETNSNAQSSEATEKLRNLKTNQSSNAATINGQLQNENQKVIKQSKYSPTLKRKLPQKQKNGQNLNKSKIAKINKRSVENSNKITKVGEKKQKSIRRQTEDKLKAKSALRKKNSKKNKAKQSNNRNKRGKSSAALRKKMSKQ